MAFGDRHPPTSWRAFSDLGSQWRLLSFAERKPPTWESFWQDHRKYWGVDDPAARSTRPWFWKIFTEESFLEKAKVEYKNLVMHYSRWCGSIPVGRPVQVVLLASSRIVLSMDWKGEISDHEDLDLHLYREHKAFILPGKFVCEIFSYGTQVTLATDEEVIIGRAKPGSRRVQHSKAKPFGPQDYTVSFNAANAQITVWDACFQTSANKDA